ncbi:MAG TPA: tetratricopeptide repeat protein [Thermoanaerobaculia bacterium]
MRKRLVALGAGGLLVAVVGVAAAMYFGRGRDFTTSSSEAERVFREALQNERAYYLKEAREGFAKALELDPQFAEAMLGLARMTPGDQSLMLARRAAKERDRLTERERLHVDTQLALREGRRDDALRFAQITHEKYPDDIRAAMMLANHEIDKGNTERAQEIFKELLAVEPNNALAYNSLGYYHAYRGEYELAMENIRKYQFMAPDQANPYDSLGEIQAYSGHYDEAIQNLNQVLKMKPDFFLANLHLGIAYEGKGDYARAIEALRRGAREANNDDVRRQHLREAIRVAFAAHDAAQARQLIEEFRAVPGDKNAEITRAVTDALLALLDNRPAETERLLRAVAPKIVAAYSEEMSGKDEKMVDDPGWTYLMAQALAHQGKTAEAISYCEKLDNPQNTYGSFEQRHWVYSGRALLAELVARQGDLDRAEKLLAENRKWNPSWAPARASEEVVAQLRREKVLAASK